jgi:hypothetical protein
MNIGSVELQEYSKTASREAEDGENNNRDVLMYESIPAERIGMSAVVVLSAYII